MRTIAGLSTGFGATCQTYLWALLLSIALARSTCADEPEPAVPVQWTSTPAPGGLRAAAPSLGHVRSYGHVSRSSNPEGHFGL